MLLCNQCKRLEAACAGKQGQAGMVKLKYKRLKVQQLRQEGKMSAHELPQYWLQLLKTNS